MVTRLPSALCVVWAVVSGALAMAGFGSANADARLLVAAATAIGVGAAVLAAFLLSRGRERWAGLCLVASAVTPTWGAAALNLLPLLAGVVLLVRPGSGTSAGTRGQPPSPLTS